MIITDELQRLRQALDNDHISDLFKEAEAKSQQSSDIDSLTAMISLLTAAIVEINERQRRTMQATQPMLDGFAHFMQSSERSTKAVAKKFDKIDQRLERLESLVEDLIDGMAANEAHLEMLETGEQPITLEDFEKNQSPS